ncbi:sulfatase-like hydrolase/transferase [Halalkalicoccus sp. NIPERK01]|uniref:sulfatase-like hydrolase/transferase n=1 Tax=Halalkalicoccus sp. NIPERK01 TaxID=3053469 RepID=UPI00256EACB1|nr:sulfatase-like hydrolase/transferase [Halalkalicoccus sp. NIPERK01]MDL5363690.1 sulfatase-like hydrolase/transferase [Halalkalicoccus sp. NIPERK01]
MSDPNVLFLLTDQERYDLTAPDSPVETPAIDRLREEGMVFERAYTPISICSAARASLLTGLYPHNHGMLNNCHEPDAIRPNLPPELPTFGELLSEAGYHTAYVGKWHVGRDQGPGDFGFEYRGGADRHHDADLAGDFEAYRDDLGVEVDEEDLEGRLYTDTGTLVAATDPVPVEATRPYYIAQQAIERLHEGFEDPFFLRVDLYGPHHPYVVPEPYASMYDPDEIDPPGSYRETYDGKPAVHEQYLDYRGVRGFDWETWSEAIAKYRGFMTLLDDQVGRILDAAEGIEGLCTIHASDHGDFTGNHRQFNKGPIMYDETYHIPLQVRWPGEIEAGSTCEEFVSLHDLMPTFLDLVGVEIPDVDGRSIRPLLSGDVPDDWPDAHFAQYHGDEFGLYSQRMLRTERYKYVHNGPDRNELYDLEADPNELGNLIEHPAYVDVRRDLEARLIERMEAVDDPIAPWTATALGR